MTGVAEIQPVDGSAVFRHLFEVSRTMRGDGLVLCRYASCRCHDDEFESIRPCHSQD